MRRLSTVAACLLLSLGNASSAEEFRALDVNSRDSERRSGEPSRIHAAASTREEYDAARLAAPTHAPVDDVIASPDDGESPVIATTFASTLLQNDRPLSATPTPFIASPSDRLTSRSPNLFGSNALPRSTLGRDTAPTAEFISGGSSKVRATTDIGDLLSKTPQSAVGAQNRSPIITDPRIRGFRNGQFVASGSYWAPARFDLDTALSKIDSRTIEGATVIKGPYSTLFGSGYNFIDVRLMPARRSDQGYQAIGLSSVEYKTNGQQFYGRQGFEASSGDWGIRAGYGQRVGNDYFTGGSSYTLPSSYNSRDVDLAIGYDFSPTSHFDFNFLRLDQTNVELPAYIYDLGFLATEAYEMTWTLDEGVLADRYRLHTWYNGTRFRGDMTRKRDPGFAVQSQLEQSYDNFFNNNPGLGVMVPPGGVRLDSTAHANVMTAGGRSIWSWGDPNDVHVDAGTDFLHLRQQLTEDFTANVATTALLSTGGFTETREGIPFSYLNEIGFFAQAVVPQSDDWLTAFGGRLGYAHTDVLNNSIAPVSILVNANVPLSRDDLVASAFMTQRLQFSDTFALTSGMGYASRIPTLSERYSDGYYGAAIQSGLNRIFTQNAIRKEENVQFDIGMHYDDGALHGGANVFTAFVMNYITFEQLPASGADPNFLIGGSGRALSFINTGLATLAGGELYSSYDWNPWMTPFVTARYVDGRDQIINAPLFGISPLNSTIGIRFHDPNQGDRWSVEWLARVAPSQYRLGTIRFAQNPNGTGVSVAEQQTPGFAYGDVRAYWRAAPRWLLTGGIENFTNTFYREHLDLRNGISANGNTGVYRPGINVYMGTEVTY